MGTGCDLAFEYQKKNKESFWCPPFSPGGQHVFISPANSFGGALIETLQQIVATNVGAPTGNLELRLDVANGRFNWSPSKWWAPLQMDLRGFRKPAISELRVNSTRNQMIGGIFCGKIKCVWGGARLVACQHKEGLVACSCFCPRGPDWIGAHSTAKLLVW